MTTLQPPAFRNLGRQAVTWNQARMGGKVYVDSNPSADYAGIVGGETITINKDGGGAVAVNFLAGDTTIAAIVARVNAAIPGAAAPNASGDSWRLKGDVSLVITTSAADYDKHGMPQASRDVANTAFSYIELEAREAENDRIDKISNEIVIPDGTNELVLWTTYDLVVPGNRLCNPVLFMGWGNGTEGVMPGTDLLEVFMDALALNPSPTGLLNANMTRDVEIGVPFLNVIGATPVTAAEKVRRVIRVGVPAGATKAYLIGQGVNEDTSVPGKYPWQCPYLTVAVNFGGRLR